MILFAGILFAVLGTTAGIMSLGLYIHGLFSKSVSEVILTALGIMAVSAFVIVGGIFIAGLLVTAWAVLGTAIFFAVVSLILWAVNWLRGSRQNDWPIMFAASLFAILVGLFLLLG